MAENKRQHYLAQSYLRGFADQKQDDAIWQYRKSTNGIRLKGIGNVAEQSYYYSFEDAEGSFNPALERWFATVESWWPSLLKKIHSNLEMVNTGNRALRITEKDRVRLLQFLLIHYLRVPKTMDWMKAYVQERHPRRNQLTSRDVRNLRIEGLTSSHNDMVEPWVTFLISRNLSIEATPAGSGVTLFTSDNPVISTGGIAFDSTHLLFPVSRRAFIRLAGPRTMADAVTVKVHHDLAFVHDFNQRIVSCATDEVYASNRDQLEILCNEVAGISV